MTAIPAILSDFIADARALREDWRYTNVADLAQANVSAPQPTYITREITEDATIPFIFHGGFPTGDIRVRAGVTLNLMASMFVPPPMAERVSLNKLKLTLEPGARVNHIRTTDYDTDHAAFVRITVDVMEDAHYHMYTLTTGGRRMRQEFVVNLLGERAAATLTCAYVLKGMAHHDLGVHINHLAPHTTSNQLIKGMAADTARGAFQGRIHVAQVAQHTQAYQLHKALLLGERAEVNAKPELEIFADQVQCSHGNTVGDLDAAALFFLQSRGISEHNARAMLMRAFVAETLASAPEAHRAMLAEKLEAVL
jgi:Fe-S cluster assembly protein SufD